MASCKRTRPINCNVDFDASNLNGRTAIVTGGANGLGEAYVRALLGVGAFVTVGDLDITGGERLVNEFPDKVKFVKCNVSSWDDQVKLFKEATSFPSGNISYVVANAGIITPDEVFQYAGDGQEPVEPKLSTIDVNTRGTLFTTKLSTHYFIKQNGQTPSSSQADTCLILISSGAGIHDCLRIPQYCATKWAVRGIMHSLRRTSHFYGSRVNIISPWYVKTKILSDEVFDDLKKKGVEFATLDDAGQCLLRLLSDTKINGRSLFLSARKWAPRGYIDLDLEDTEENEMRREIQDHQMRGEPVEAGLFP